ncbi:cyclopropane-fatty-acyl-phospholipid synthase [Microvirga flocculans]|uniref:Cyclopropane-fatty-acyl-phospholipid synthase n=1 Tax=Microvirga flocculans TaxID=217168 RepID=A0A7W6IFQ5_9HYPH|nr:cyclopropane-fatty-acyl-phospholipid synthase family protein [Microvirga flocculans]MBB4040479.1 cyclopropane-fatty-acyl-phospholipid synthase [Microvirga flocculans]
MTLHNAGEPFAEGIALRRNRRLRGLAPSFLAKLLAAIQYGSLVVVTPSGERIRHEKRNPGPEAILVLHRWRALRRLASRGDLGFAQGYIDGDWTTPDLTTLIELAAINTGALTRIINGFWPMRVLNRINHLLRANTRSGSRKNIAFHYDLGNDFYELWLDRTMTYSSALFTRGNMSLEEAQDAKLDRIAQLLQLASRQTVLEIGCGWGALAKKLADEHDASVTALTLSKEQRAHALSVAETNGLGDRIDIRLQDYRDVTGTFDRIVSIEMLEAVGEAYWPAYFSTLRRCLKPGGRAVLQVITIAEDRYDSYRSGADFIQTHIFPGGMLPSKALLKNHIEAAGLGLAHAESFGLSYAQTLAEWRIRFHRAWPDIEKLGFDDRFRRMWDYYLCYCEAGFRTNAIDVGLYVVTKE